MLKALLPAVLLAFAASAGEATTDPAAKALDWLTRHQCTDGHWSGAEFDACCPGAKCAGPAVPDYDVGLSALAVLAFLEHGEIPRKGLDWLKAQQSPDGCLGPKKYDKYLYNHVLGTLALARAAGRGQPGLKDPVQKAVDYLLACQSPGAAWRYKNYNLAGTQPEEGGPNDISVTAWAVHALAAAREAGLKVTDKALKDASAWLGSVWDIVGDKERYGYYRKANGALGLIHNRPYTTTAAGLMAHGLLARLCPAPPPPPPGEPPGNLDQLIEDLGAPKYEVREAATESLRKCGASVQAALEKASKSRDPETRCRAETLLASLRKAKGADVPRLEATLFESSPGWKACNFYYWQYGAMALEGSTSEGALAWKKALKETLLDNQVPLGCAAGSWDAHADQWGQEGGRVYMTALGALCLMRAK